MDPIACLAERPERSAIVLDVDGTLAPIVARPEDAHVPAETRAVLERLAERYGLLAFLTGRTAADARSIVGVDGARYVGIHGLELEPEADRWRPVLAELREQAGWPLDELDDKGATLAFHFRRADDQGAARDRLREVAELARSKQLVPSFGRKVLEVRPPIEADKGTAVRRLVAESRVSHALYAGDDTTDLDAFRGLAEAGLEQAVRVAVASGEGPPALVEQADLVVSSPEELLELLRRL